MSVPYIFGYTSEKTSGCVASRVSDSRCDTSRVFPGRISEGHTPDSWKNIYTCQSRIYSDTSEKYLGWRPRVFFQINPRDMYLSLEYTYMSVPIHSDMYQKKNSGCVTSRVSDSGCDTSRVFAGHISEGHIPDFWINIHATPVYIRKHIWKKNSGCLASRIRHYGIYRVAKIHRMPWVAGHFPQKSH